MVSLANTRVDVYVRVSIFGGCEVLFRYATTVWADYNVRWWHISIRVDVVGAFVVVHKVCSLSGLLSHWTLVGLLALKSVQSGIRAMRSLPDIAVCGQWYMSDLAL